MLTQPHYKPWKSPCDDICSVIDFVRGHPKGEAFARKALATDLKQGRVTIERPRSEFAPPPARPAQKTVTDADEWRSISFRTDDVELARAINESPRPARIAPMPNTNAYASSAQGIHMDALEKEAHTVEAQAAWRHEYGHHLDMSHTDAANGYGYASAGPAAVAAMRKDAAAMVRRSKSADARILADQLRGKTAKEIDIELKNNGVYLTTAEIADIAGQQNVSDAAAALISRDAKAYLEAAHRNRSSDVAIASHEFSSDAIEAITQARIGGPAAGMRGHGVDYYNKFDQISGGYTSGHGTEAFANYITLRGAKEMAPSYKALRHLAPETAKVYDEIISSYRSNR